jgi:uncharacterized protein
MKTRYIAPFISQDLSRKMIFIGGPRQVGKTTLARLIASKYSNNIYLNWDNPKHKIQITGQQWSPEVECLVLDEIHKYDKWKNLVKGI